MDDETASEKGIIFCDGLGLFAFLHRSVVFVIATIQVNVATAAPGEYHWVHVPEKRSVARDRYSVVRRQQQ